MKTKVKTIWGQGMVSVGSPIVDKAVIKREDLIIEHQKSGAIMVVPYDKLKEKRPRYERFTDKRTGRTYYLYDFIWKGNK